MSLILTVAYQRMIFPSNILCFFLLQPEEKVASTCRRRCSTHRTLSISKFENILQKGLYATVFMRHFGSQGLKFKDKIIFQGPHILQKQLDYLKQRLVSIQILSRSYQWLEPGKEHPCLGCRKKEYLYLFLIHVAQFLGTPVFLFDISGLQKSYQIPLLIPHGVVEKVFCSEY